VGKGERERERREFPKVKVRRINTATTAAANPGKPVPER